MIKTAIKLTPVDMAERTKIDFRSGDTVRVTTKIVEGAKTRLQAFEGLVLSRKHGNKTTNAMFTVRKVASGVGVERIFPLFSPMIDKIEITKKSNARRSKLYYIRTKAIKDVRKKMRSVVTGVDKDSEIEEKMVAE